jgi:PucR-like helix-turn-helix protein
VAVARKETGFEGKARVEAGPEADLVREVAAAAKHLERALAIGFSPARAKAVELETRASRAQRAGRERLHSLLLSDPPAAGETLAEAAAAADWQLPERTRVAVAPLAAGWGRGPTPSRVVWGLRDEYCVLVVADDGESEGWLDRTADALGLGRPLVLGATSDLRRAGYAAARAIALSELLGAGPDHPFGRRIVRYDEHEVDVLLALDRELSRSISDRLLAPLAALPPPRRERMLETLDAWLANPGRPRAMAVQLHLHVQGVRYRLAQLRELFGDALDDPDSRFELALALRLRRSAIQRPVSGA